MKNNKQSITLKVIVGYLLIAALAAFAVWFVYSQVQDYTSMAETNIATNNKLYLVGDAAANLYEAESLSRQVIRTGDSVDLELYKSKVDTIRLTLEALEETYTDTVLKKEILSINFLLSQKTANLEELLELRGREENQSYYAKVLTELQRVDESFGTPNYEERFKDLEPHQRRVLVKWLEYAELDNPQQVTSQKLDSLVNSVRMVLIDFERADRRFRQTLRQKENELLANEVNINSQLRNLLSTIEREERESSLAQVEASQEMVKSTSKTIAILGAISFLVILIFLLLVVQDVSRSQRYRNKLEEAKQYAESLLKSREQFMATVTHDLRSPLNTVVGYSSLLEKSNLNSSQRHYLEHLKKSSDYILRLVNDLLDLSKLEAGKMLVEELTFNPKNLIEDTVESAVPLEKPEEVSVEIRIAEELNAPIVSDPFRIKQILTNLITNACKFTEKGKVSIIADLEEKRKRKVLVVRVKDTGIGISKEKREEIFEEFSQENTSIEKRFGGSGLGLAISKKLVELLKGRIELQSEPGKGSEFIVRIPVELGEDFSTAPETLISPTETLGDYSVLIVDDEPAQISLLQELVRSTGMSSDTANNGQEALKKLSEGKFDLVVTDIQMPRMDGFELMENIRADKKIAPIPVIALSGKTDVPTEEYQNRGFSGNLLKPYTPEELLRIIERVLKVVLPGKETSAPAPEGAPTSKTYSLEEVKLFAGGDTVAMKKILLAFIESSEANLQALREAHKSGDKEKMAGIAHKMLPMFRQVRAVRVISKLAAIEHPGHREPRAEELESLAQEIEVLMKELRQEIKD